jgi:hypothetical protein
MRSKPSHLALSGMAFAETASASTASIHQRRFVPTGTGTALFYGTTGTSTLQTLVIARSPSLPSAPPANSPRLAAISSSLAELRLSTSLPIRLGNISTFWILQELPVRSLRSIWIKQRVRFTTAIGTTPPATGAGSIGMAIDPTGALLAVDNNADTNISLYKVSTSTGALTISSPATVGTDLNPQYVVFYTAASDQ